MRIGGNDIKLMTAINKNKYNNKINNTKFFYDAIYLTHRVIKLITNLLDWGGK